MWIVQNFLRVRDCMFLRSFLSEWFISCRKLYELSLRMVKSYCRMFTVLIQNRLHSNDFICIWKKELSMFRSRKINFQTVRWYWYWNCILIQATYGWISTCCQMWNIKFHHFGHHNKLMYIKFTPTCITNFNLNYCQTHCWESSWKSANFPVCFRYATQPW